MKLQGRKISPGIVAGEALVTSMGISFFGGVDPESGVVVERGHELEGRSIAGKILVFPTGKGSTVGSYTLYRLKFNGKAPLAVVNAECETITAVGCIIGEIPCVDQIAIQQIRTGQKLIVNGEAGEVYLGPMAAPLSPIPALPLPPALRGCEPGTFTEATMTRRLPGIARRTAQDAAWHPQAAARLEALAADMPHGRLRPIDDPGAPDSEAWAAYLAPWLGRTWLEAPWFDAEIYFFRRILEASGYFQPGAGHGVDPYRPQKHEGLAGVLEALEPLCAETDAMRMETATQNRTPSQSPPSASLRHLLHSVVWGNQADLSIFPAGGGQPARPSEEQLATHLLVDDAAAACNYLCSRPPGEARVDFILDNVGLELADDLLLADFLLSSRLAGTVYLHAKAHPTYVSDATTADILEMMTYLEQSERPSVSQMGKRIQEYHLGRRLRLCAEDYWVSPLPGWEMTAALRQELAQSDLLISKGDANYRRWLGDRHWDFTAPFASILAYRPAPVLVLRVLKSQIITGLPPGKAEEMDRQEPDWMYNGHWGVIQFSF